MALRSIPLLDRRPQPWTNGGGTTRELLAWAPSAGAPWRLRVSVATIDRDGPFSSLPGVRRWFAVLAGAGVILQLPGGERRVLAGGEALEFDGADAPDCRLVDGTTQDLNLMIRGGTGSMWKFAAGQAQRLQAAQGGFYAAAAGRLTAGAQAVEVAAQTLVWCAERQDDVAWEFRPAGHAGEPMGFWLAVKD